MAKQTGGVAGAVEQLVRPVVEGLNLRLWDVRYEKEGPEWFLRVLIDRDEPLDTDTCEVVSRAIDPLLDKADLIEQSYYLEVGSPGLGRKLTRPEHFTMAMGEKILAALIRPDEQKRKEISGILQNATAEQIVLETEQGEEVVLLKSTSFVKLCDDEDLFKKNKK